MKPFLRGKKINIRHLSRADFAQYLSLSNDVSTMGEHWILSEVRTEESLSAKFSGDGYFGDQGGRVLITDHTDRIVGVLAYFKPVFFWEAMELGCRIFLPSDHGKGYATEAVTIFAAFLFESKRITRLQITADPANIAANSVAKKAGFTLEGCIRQALFCRGKMRDQNLWSLLPDEGSHLSSLIKSAKDLV
jgi:ribosomal-protein-alanine N-acetyltransferase